jgi:hypothetical protein
VAVSTAVGALDFIVVETASDAQKCVEFLRRSQLGVATFLILEKQRHLAAAAAEQVQTPEGEARVVRRRARSWGTWAQHMCGPCTRVAVVIGSGVCRSTASHAGLAY